MSKAAALAAIDRIQEALSWRKRDRLILPWEKKLAALMRKRFLSQWRAIEKTFLPAVKRDVTLQEAETPANFPAQLLQLLVSLLAVSREDYEATVQAILAQTLMAAHEAQRRDLQLDFTLPMEDALAIMRDRAGALITGIDEVTRDQVRDMIVAAQEQRLTYTQLARQLRQRFQQFRMPVRRPRHIRDRAELIAVTEIAKAFVDGQLLAGQRLRSAGIEMEKRNLTVGDERVSDGCKANQEAGWIPLESAFPSGHQGPPRFPGCRCSLQMRRKQGGST